MSTGPLATIDYTESELVLGFVYAVGSNVEPVQSTLKKHLKKFGYTANTVKLSQYLPKLVNELHLGVALKGEPEHKRIDSYMDAGDRCRDKLGRGDALALCAVADIHERRKASTREETKEPYPKTAHVLMSLRHPDEVIALRRIYGAGFFLIGVFATQKERLDYLTEEQDILKKEAERLIERDQGEEEAFGQQTRDTFGLADVYVRLKGDEYRDQLWRFLDLAFGSPFETPSLDENGMFLAYAASSRSSSLSRQVGAAVTTKEGDFLSVGCNDVPAAGGGLYWPGPLAQRDHEYAFKEAVGADSNEYVTDEIISDIVKKLAPPCGDAMKLDEAKKLLERSLLMNITEYGRAVHAEMEALLSCARVGVSPRNSTLYATTFPCHNCARHIIDAGINRVVYIEPYPKSRAKELHSDSIVLKGEEEQQDHAGTKRGFRVALEPFIGVGPRRYFDLFSMRLSSGYPVKRKTRDGRAVSWSRDQANIRIPLLPTSYIQRETLAGKELATAKQEAMEAKDATT